MRAQDVDRDAFRQLFPEIRNRFDYCIVDAPAGLGSGFQLALAGADRAVVGKRSFSCAALTGHDGDHLTQNTTPIQPAPRRALLLPLL